MKASRCPCAPACAYCALFNVRSSAIMASSCASILSMRPSSLSWRASIAAVPRLQALLPGACRAARARAFMQKRRGSDGDA